jgi:hypothetical protein
LLLFTGLAPFALMTACLGAIFPEGARGFGRLAALHSRRAMLVTLWLFAAMAILVVIYADSSLAHLS